MSNTTYSDTTRAQERARLIDQFKDRYGSFESEDYLRDERNYKMRLVEYARDNLARPQLAAFIANAEFDEGAKAIRRAYQRSENNLLNAWDRLPLENAPNEELVRSLFDLLYGDDPFDERFARWIELLSRDKPNCWPAATFFLMLLEPERHMFVKPGPFRTLQIRLRPELSWTTRPTAEAYQAILDMSRDLFEHLQPLGARDMIDVQSFVWIIQPEHERAWIFQSNPKYYDLGGALATLEQFAWSARQRASDMRVGDTVYLWEAGDNAGIRAVATITGEPEIMGSDAPDQAFYLDLAQFKPSDRQVPLRVERVLSRTLTRAELLQHPQLSKLQIIVQPNATNYKVSENDAVALESLTAQIPDVPKGLRMPLEQPPRPLDGPAFVVVDSVDGQSQVTDQTFSFTTYSVGERPKLLDALRAFQSGGPPVYLLVYRPSPRYAFTAWARVRSVHEEQGSRPDNPNTMRWTLALDQHEFPVPLKLKTNAERLTSRIPWLANGLMAAFQGYSIRQIEPAQFHLIVSEAHKAAITPPDPDRPEWKPEIYAGQDAQFWRIHFPRDMWPDAYQHHTIGIGFDENPTDQSVKRFLRIKPGDRVVAYVQGGTIGSFGVVTEAYRPDQQLSASAAALFGNDYRRRLGVAWADTPDRPVSLLDELKQPERTALYNRLKNPQTVIPLSRDDYTDILTLLQVDDVGTPTTETRLPSAWPAPHVYRDFAHSLEVRPLTATELVNAARAHDAALNPLIDVDGFVEDMRRMRLIRVAGDDQYEPWSHTRGDAGALLKLTVLALLVPVEGSADMYDLPARRIVRQLREATGPQPIASFASELGSDQNRLISWYREAGFVTIDSEAGTWAPAPGALEPTGAADPASSAYDVFVRTLLAELDQSLPTDLEPVQGPLPPSRNIEAFMGELGRDLLIDERVVRRIYRSLMAGRHVILSGPPGTGKTELATRLPRLLWQEPEQEITRLPANLNEPPATTIREQRHGYAALVVTATEDWGVRDVVGGIAPQLDAEKRLTYAIQYGALTRAILQHYEGTSQGRQLPLQRQAPKRVDYRDEGRNRHRGVWLVIDEFTRAPVDAAFGSLLTMLSGGDSAVLTVPTSDGTSRDLPVPQDFRIIGTLNSFDRHFLNQMSEAIKRRFDFIDVLPPPPGRAPDERGIAAARALRRLHAQGFTRITVQGDPPAYRLDDVAIVPNNANNGLRYAVEPLPGSAAESALQSLWDIFDAVRIFRQLGTAQLVALHTNVFAGVLIGMQWSDALDTALADSLADQLQVLTHDEQHIVVLYLETAGDPERFQSDINTMLYGLPPARRVAMRMALREAERLRRQADPTITREDQPLSSEQLRALFALEQPLVLPNDSVFRRRLMDLVGERGL